MITRARIGAAAALATHLVAASAAAERIGLATLEVGEAPATAAEVKGALAAAGAGAAVRDPFAAAAAARERGAVPRDRLEAFAEAKTLAEGGWRAFAGVEPERALRLLEDARGAAAELLDLPGGAELVADIALRAGAVHLALGRRREARAELALARALDPAREVTTASFSPEVVEAYEDAASREDAALVEVAVASEPPGATLVVDGSARGEAPLRLELAPGPHAMVARAPGRQPAARVVQVEPTAAGEELEIRLSLARDEHAQALEAGSRALAVGAEEAAAARAVEAALVYADLDAALLAAAVWRRGKPTLLGQRCGGVPVGCGRPVEIRFRDPGDLGAAARRLWEAAGEQGARPPTLQIDPRVLRAEPAPPPVPARPEVAAGARQPWWGSPWLWGGVGAAALGAAAAILVTGDGEPIPEVEIPACEFGGC